MAGYHLDTVSNSTVADYSGNGNDGTVVGNVAWSAGFGMQEPIATLTTALPPGNSITALYAGDDDYLPAVSSPIVQTVTPAYNAVAGQQLSFSVTIDNPDLQPGDLVEIDWGDGAIVRRDDGGQHPRQFGRNHRRGDGRPHLRR